MIEVLFKLKGVSQKEMAMFDTIHEMQYFIKNYESQVLENYPEATDIQLGKIYTGVSKTNKFLHP